MEEIKDSKFIKYINSPIQKLLSVSTYLFSFDEDTQSIYVQDNHCFTLEKEDVEVLIKGLRNSLINYPEEEFKEWNENKLHRKRDKKIDVTKIESKPKPKKKGYIYFIQDGLGLVKIGLTKNVRERLKTFRVGNHSIKLFHYIKTRDMELTENLFHEYFKDKKVGGEWFRLTKKDLDYVKKGKYSEAIIDSLGDAENE